MISIMILHVLSSSEISYAQLKSLPPLPEANQSSTQKPQTKSESDSEIEEDPAIKELKSIFDDEELKNLTIPEKNNKTSASSLKDEEEQENAEEPIDNFDDPLLGDGLEFEDITEEPNLGTESDTNTNQPIDSIPKKPDNIQPKDSKPSKNDTKKNISKKTDDKDKTQNGNSSKFEPSFGEYNFSIFFPPQSFKNYLTVIEEVEREVFLNGDLNSRLSTAINDIDEEILVEDETEEVPLEKIGLPHYYLISILYHNPSRWAVMVNGITLTSENNDVQKELYVRAINPKRVELTWKPQEFRAFTKALSQSEKLEEYKKDAHFKKILHRKTKSIGNYIKINEEAGTIDFALQPNQVFYMQYMNIYEGNPKDILPPPPPTLPQETQTPNTNQPQGNNPNDLQKLLEQSTPRSVMEKLESANPNNNNN